MAFRPQTLNFDALEQYLKSRPSTILPILKGLELLGGPVKLLDLRKLVAGSPSLVAQDLAVAEEQGLIAINLEQDVASAELTPAGRNYLSEVA